MEAYAVLFLIGVILYFLKKKKALDKMTDEGSKEFLIMLGPFLMFISVLALILNLLS